MKQYHEALMSSQISTKCHREMSHMSCSIKRFLDQWWVFQRTRRPTQLQQSAELFTTNIRNLLIWYLTSYCSGDTGSAYLTRDGAQRDRPSNNTSHEPARLDALIKRGIRIGLVDSVACRHTHLTVLT